MLVESCDDGHIILRTSNDVFIFNLGCVLKGCFEIGIFWRTKLCLNGIEDFNLECCPGCWKRFLRSCLYDVRPTYKLGIWRRKKQHKKTNAILNGWKESQKLDADEVKYAREIAWLHSMFMLKLWATLIIAKKANTSGNISSGVLMWMHIIITMFYSSGVCTMGEAGNK